MTDGIKHAERLLYLLGDDEYFREDVPELIAPALAKLKVAIDELETVVGMAEQEFAYLHRADSFVIAELMRRQEPNNWLYPDEASDSTATVAWTCAGQLLKENDGQPSKEKRRTYTAREAA